MEPKEVPKDIQTRLMAALEKKIKAKGCCSGGTDPTKL
jgi:hypothetical protein